MSIIENSQPVDPANTERLSEEAEGAPSLTSSGLWRRSRDTRDAIQNIRESDQDLRESSQDLREVKQESQQSDQDTRETTQDSRENNQDLRESSQDTREASQDLREAGEEFLLSGQALLNLEVRYQLLVDSVTDYAIYMLDPEGRVVTWNVGAERSKGYKAEEVLGKNFSIFFLPEDVAAGLPADELETAESQGRYETEAWRVRKDGTQFWAMVTLTAIRDPNGELHGFAKVTRDMSAHKAAEESTRAVNAQLERYRFIVGSVADHMIFTLDTDGKIDSWSTGAQNVLGYTASEALGREYSLLFTKEEREAGRPQREMEEAARTGHCMTDDWRVRKDGTHFWVSGALTAVRDELGTLTGYIRVARDMTLQKRLEESMALVATDMEKRVVERTRELQETVAELQRKNQEVEAFVHIVSHDLRAPLVNVQGFVRELEESTKTLKTALQTCPQWESCWPSIRPIMEDDVGGALHYISASTAKFERLINALLRLSRQGRQVYQLTRVNVWELVTNSVATFQQLIVEVGAEVEIGALPSVTADTTALGQVFSNLIGNAIKYRSPQRSLRIEIGGQVEEGIVHYWVRDNGLGIPEYGKAKLFQVFQRFHPKQAEGEGMGLAIAHRIVERLGGKIWADSKEGEGTTFHYSLPANPANPPKGS
jgi:PAS domain S-box-containing protein